MMTPLVSIPHRKAEIWNNYGPRKRERCVSIPHRKAEINDDTVINVEKTERFQSLIGRLKSHLAGGINMDSTWSFNPS